MRKVAGQLCRRICGELAGCYSLGLTLALVATKEKKLVMTIETRQDNRATSSCAELVPLKNITLETGLVIEETIGVEGVITDVIIAGHVQRIGAGLGYNADYATAITAILSRVVVFQNFEFLYGVRVRIEDDTVTEQVVVDAAIEKKRHRIRAAAGNVETACSA